LFENDLLLALIDKVADAFEISRGEIKLCLDQVVFNISNVREELQKLGIRAGAKLTLVKQAAAPTVEYRVMQGPLFKKSGKEPTSTKIVKLTRPVGSKLRTTGQTWTGPSGGQWVEVDELFEKPGWLLIEGPGFDQPGLLLEKVEPGEEEPLVLLVRDPLDCTLVCNICVKPSETIAHAKCWVALRWPGLRPHKIECPKEQNVQNLAHSKFRSFAKDELLSSDTLLKDTQLRDGDEFIYRYIGDSQEDLARKNGSEPELPAGFRRVEETVVDSTGDARNRNRQSVLQAFTHNIQRGLQYKQQLRTSQQ